MSRFQFKKDFPRSKLYILFSDDEIRRCHFHEQVNRFLPWLAHKFNDDVNVSWGYNQCLGVAMSSLNPPYIRSYFGLMFTIQEWNFWMRWVGKRSALLTHFIDGLLFRNENLLQKQNLWFFSRIKKSETFITQADDMGLTEKFGWV